MPLYDTDIPVAHAMMNLLSQQPLETFDAYCCTWSAFNSIYSFLSKGGKHAPKLTKKTRRIGTVTIPKATGGSERGQISMAARALPPRIKHELIMASEAEFFVKRTPTLHDVQQPSDKNGQRLNGVLNVGHTIATGELIWSPIDRAAYERYVQGNGSRKDRNSLIGQLALVLYAVRNNTFHGGKIRGNDTDEEVLENALPLLRRIVLAFM